MNDVDVDADILAYLLETGWTHAAVFVAPNYALSDWMRDRGKDEWADLLVSESSRDLTRLRSMAYLWAPPDQSPALKQCFQDMVKGLKAGR